MSADDPDTHDGPEPLVRSIFFYNQHPQLQSTVVQQVLALAMVQQVLPLLLA